MKVNGMPVGYFIYGLEKAAAYFRGNCTFSYVTIPDISFERLLINETYCLVIDEENVVSLIATEGESERVIALADDVALENHTLDFVKEKGIHMEEIPVNALLEALESYRDSKEPIEFKFYHHPERIVLYVGETLVEMNQKGVHP